jgi:hypothetical protein
MATMDLHISSCSPWKSISVRIFLKFLGSGLYLTFDFTILVINAKDGRPECKTHRSGTCSSCFGFKKTIVKLNKDAKGKGRGRKNAA